MGESFRLSQYGNQGGGLSHEEKKTNAKISIFKRKKKTLIDKRQKQRKYTEKKKENRPKIERKKKI